MVTIEVTSTVKRGRIASGAGATVLLVCALHYGRESGVATTVCLACALHYGHEFDASCTAAVASERERMEMRKDIRYRLDAPAVFSWEGGRHGRFHGEGMTRDISVQGAFILSATLPPPDCPIQIDLLLPSLTGMSTVMRITGKARVTRVERCSGDSWIHGFAVVTDGNHDWGLQTMPSEPQFEFANTAAVH